MRTSTAIALVALSVLLVAGCKKSSSSGKHFSMRLARLAWNYPA